MTINFDMDGTIANLYADSEWLHKLRAFDASPYAEATPLVSCARLAKAIHKAQRAGYQVGIISWLSKCSNADYDEAVTQAKLKWLARHLPSVRFDTIHIVPYGTPKSNFAEQGAILFDDEERNRAEWCGEAYAPEQIFEILRNL